MQTTTDPTMPNQGPGRDDRPCAAYFGAAGGGGAGALFAGVEVFSGFLAAGPLCPQPAAPNTSKPANKTAIVLRIT
jgi:hypothetical protein